MAASGYIDSSFAITPLLRLYQRQQLRPRHHLHHWVQKQLPLALTTKPLKTRLGRQCLLPHRAHPLLIILTKQSAGLGLVQSLPNCGVRHTPIQIVVCRVGVCRGVFNA